jgi:PhnB protein
MSMPAPVLPIRPMLSLRNAAHAVEWYQRAFGARETSRHTSPDGKIVALLAIGDLEFGVVDETTEVGNFSPETLGGTTVRMRLDGPDPDAMAQRAVEAGAELLFPVEDQPYGMRQGRIRDPLGTIGSSGDRSRKSTWSEWRAVRKPGYAWRQPSAILQAWIVWRTGTKGAIAESFPTRRTAVRLQCRLPIGGSARWPVVTPPGSTTT